MNSTKLLLVMAALFCSFEASAQFAKVDFRAHTELNDYLVVFCTSERGADSYMYIATVTGNQKSGYSWDQTFGAHGRGTRESSVPAVKQNDIQQCADQSLSAKSQALAVNTESTKYAGINDIIASTASNTSAINRASLVSRLLGLRMPVPRNDQHFRQYVSELIVKNALTPGEAGLLSGWTPVSIRSELDEIKVSQTDTELETGIPEVPRIRAKALKTLYQALADAEDKPWNHYDIELEITDTTVVQTTVRRTVMLESLRLGSVNLPAFM